MKVVGLGLGNESLSHWPWRWVWLGPWPCNIKVNDKAKTCKNVSF